MIPPSPSPTRIAIVGGGIAGLAAAFELQQAAREAVQVTLLEQAGRLGGVLETRLIDGFHVETSADMFSIDPPAAIELCRELGLADELLNATPTPDRAYIATEDGLFPVPRGFSLMLPGDVQAVLDSPLLSEGGKRRFLVEEQVPPRSDAADESLREFATRRFGDEVFERLIQPLASGIYTADPNALSMQATMDRFVRLERKYGSLIAAGRAQADRTGRPSDASTSGARYGLFRAPPAGIGQLVERLVSRLTDVQLRTEVAVRQLRRVTGGWRVDVQDRAAEIAETLDFDQVLLATPARVSGHLLSGVDADLSSVLQSMTAASTAIAVLGLERRQLGREFAGYGIILPHSLGRDAIACSFSSHKFTGRAPTDQVLVRVFFGGALRPDLLQRDDDELVALAEAELDRLLGMVGQPLFSRVFRWPECMPQYTLGHGERVDQIESHVAEIGGLELAGNSYRGVGIPACIDSGRQAARRLLAEQSGSGG